MTLTYRPMTADDIGATIEVRLSTVENAITLAEMRDGYGVTPESIAAGLAADAAGWVCEAAGCVVGFAMGDRATGEVTVIALRPSHEGRGIGAALMARVEDWLFAAGHDRLWLLANPDPSVRAGGFYAARGWRPAGRMRGEDVVLELARADRWPGRAGDAVDGLDAPAPLQ
ncbi:MAG: N-acetyltransferase family protein [Paracoccaceae bacterium]